MKKIIGILFLIQVFFCGEAAEFTNGTVKGIVMEEKKSPIPYATVILKSKIDSALYKGEITDEKGFFVFEKVREGDYFIEIKIIGMNKLVIENILISESNPEFNAGTIYARPVTLGLKEITVQGDKPFIERQVDRTVVNIENSAIHTGSSLMEVMEKLPGVLVDQDGNISMKGKQGVIVMMDGKPTMLSAQDLSNTLSGMSSSGVQKIEIITNPSAKYDAAGNAGIINIVSKRNRREGLSGGINGGYGQGRYAKYNAGFNLAFKDKGYNVFMNYSYSKRIVFNNLVLTRNFFNGDSLNTVFNTNNYIVLPFRTHTPRIGADFNLSKKTTLSFLASGVLNRFKPTADNHTDVMDGSGALTGSNDFTNRSSSKFYNYSGNMQIRHQFDTTGKELSVDLDYAKFAGNSDQVFNTVYKDGNGVFSGITNLVGNQDTYLDIYSVKADFTNPLKASGRFEAGLKTSYVTADANIQFFNKPDNLLLFDSSRSNHFIYDENINAGYLNLSKDIRKIKLQVGLRAEHTHANGKQLYTGQTFTRDYVQLFPTLFIDYKLNADHGLNVNLGRRIDRPAYQQMNPFRWFIDATTYAEGNPYLLPQLTYEGEFTWTFKNSFFVTLGGSVTNNNITSVLLTDGDKRITVQTNKNLYRFTYYNLNIVYSKKIVPWWTTNTSVLSYYGIYTGTLNNFSINQGIPSFNFNSNNNLSLNNTLSAEVSFLYNYKTLYGITKMKSNYNLTLGLQKKLFKNQGSLTLNVSDILWSSYPSGFTHFGGVDENWTARRDTRVVNINFSYRFGKGQTSRVRRTTGAEDEKSRAGGVGTS